MIITPLTNHQPRPKETATTRRPATGRTAAAGTGNTIQTNHTLPGPPAPFGRPPPVRIHSPQLYKCCNGCAVEMQLGVQVRAITQSMRCTGQSAHSWPSPTTWCISLTSLAAVHQAEVRYEISVDTNCGRCVAKRSDPDIAVGFEARQVVASGHSIAPMR